MRPTLRTTLLLALTIAMVIAWVPAWRVLDRTLAARLEEAAQEDLARAPMVLADRNGARADALMMHARDVAAAGGLALTLQNGDRGNAHRLLTAAAPEGESPILVPATGDAWLGVPPSLPLLEATRRGEAPVGFVRRGGRVFSVSVAPVIADGQWLGAAGVSTPVDAAMAATLAGLTAADVLILAGDSVVATTLEDSLAKRLAEGAAHDNADGSVREVEVDGGRYWTATAPLGDVARATFVVGAAEELALLPELRSAAARAGAVAFGLALLLAALLATAVSRPVRALATAADRLAGGDFHAPLDRSRLDEVDRMAAAFERMRKALAVRLEDLSTANRELEERQDKLRALQSELIRRDRLAASGRLVAELAHEIRNPVANIRNCLEVVHRRLKHDPESRRFTDLAIDELLRMHELAEQMLDLNRPLDPGASRTEPAEVVRQVAELFRLGAERPWSLELDTEAGHDVALAPDTLKQIVLNLVQNAREAMPGGGVIRIAQRYDDRWGIIEVSDDGPGIPEEHLDRVFDAFFTTKGEVSGVGLGLFIAQGLAARAGGRLRAMNLERGGASFRLELPLVGVPRRTGVPAGGLEHADY